MNGYHLRYYYDTCLLQSVTQAAEKNRVSQSAISQAIRNLEMSLNSELVVHKKNQFIMTEKGKVVFEESKKILTAIENLMCKIDPKGRVLEGKIQVGANAAVLQCIMPGVIQRFSKKYPKVKIQLTPGSCADIKNLVRKGLVDVGIIIDGSDMDGLSSLKLLKYVYQPFRVKKTNLSKIMIAGHGYPEVTSLKQAIQKKHPNNQYEYEVIPHGETIKRLCLEGYGVGFLPDFFFSKQELKSKIKKWAVFFETSFVRAVFLPHMEDSLRVESLLREMNGDTQNTQTESH